ncbi:glycine oxidase ThiO [Oleiphilus sp. HI0132]|uniref:glycine oxidase ThiO n=2 Tax=Oleiphilus sp. HI0132 TaxID=1822270 RepID=UPI000ACC66E7|nr:glycine oxidase ThiO [Oleiphilus sp. HI0132]
MQVENILLKEMRNLKVIIVGAGAIGMMQARELALKGIEVVLLDKSACGTEASWAGGGIVSPLYPWRYSEPVTALASWSQSYYPNLAQSLEAESDIDPELTRHGLLMLQVEDREAALKWSEEHHKWMETVDAEKIYELEPALREGVKDGLWMSQVSSIRNPRLLQALYTSLQRNPLVTIHEGAEVSSFLTNKDKLDGVKLHNGDEHRADAVVICSGAWSRSVAKNDGIEVKPVKGQMLIFDAPIGLVNRVVMNNGKYVIPRRDGKVLAGSTLEDVGFDKRTTEQAKEELADMAIDLFPGLASCPISAHWSGLRPGSPDGIPYIGQMKEFDNLYINAGHYRNGLVLAPASVALLSAIVSGESTPIPSEPYNPLIRV